MGLSTWLWKMFGARALGRFGAARRVAFASRGLLSLLRRRAAAPSPRAGRDAARTYSNEGREVRVHGPARVHLDATYEEWVEPLARLPHGTTAEQFRRAAESLPGYDDGGGQHFFPAAKYLAALPFAADASAALSHRCRASRALSMETLLATLPPLPPLSPPASPAEPEKLVVHNLPRRAR